MVNQDNLKDPVRLAAAHAKINAEGLNPPWRKYAETNFADYVNDGEKAMDVVTYAETVHKSPSAPAAPAINPPIPAAPAAPIAPAAPVAPNPPVAATPAAPAPQPPAAPAAPPPGNPPAPEPETNEQTALYVKLQGRGLIPANRSGRKPGVPKLRAMDAWGMTLDQFAAWESAEKAKGAAGTYDSSMAYFAANPTPVNVAPAATPAAAPNPAPVASSGPVPPVSTAPAPNPPAATSAAPQPPAPAAQPATPAAAPVANVATPGRLGFMLAINAMTNLPSVDFNRDIFPAVNARIANTDVTMDNGQTRRFPMGYQELPFARGVPLMNAALAEYLTVNAGRFGAGTVITVDAHTPAGRDALDILRAFAAGEFRGF